MRLYYQMLTEPKSYETTLCLRDGLKKFNVPLTSYDTDFLRVYLYENTNTECKAPYFVKPQEFSYDILVHDLANLSRINLLRTQEQNEIFNQDELNHLLFLQKIYECKL